MKRFLLFVLLCLPRLVLADAQVVPTPTPPPPNATPQEIEEGKKSAAEFESAKTTKMVDPNSSPANKALYDKLNGMAKRLGAASGRPGINYQVKVVESKDVNAFTLPDGHIYVYSGLVDYAGSDDELAGVLAHEIGHNVRMHALRGEKESKKMSWATLAAVAAMVAGGRSGADVGQFTQYLLVGVMNGYGVGYEKEADACGLQEMIAAGYNPSAMVTFMRRLQLLEERSPEVKLGIFQTHPPSDERADALLAQLQADKIAFTPRAVDGAKTALVTEKPDRFSVQLGDVTLLELAKSGTNASARAQSAAAKINAFLRADGQMHEVTTTPTGQLLGRGQILATGTDADAKLQNVALTALAPAWSANMERLFWRERLNGRF